MSITDRNWRGSREWRSALVPLFVVAQILVIHAAASGERPPAPPAPERFPLAFGDWRLIRADPLDAEVAAELRADRLVSQTYIETSTHSFASLLVAWFQTQQGGARQPHSPKVCLPSGGWTPRIVDEVTVDTLPAPITVNRYVVDKDTQSAVVLYWYQTPRRVIAGEWAAKFWLASDALQDKRTDTALVRVTTWPSRGGDQAATAVAAEFARDLYPKLREYLPR
jgi:EpsI family protein